jgi:putative glutamine amidotransferase
MSASLPIVAATALTEVVGGLPRVRVNRAYTDTLQRAGVIPLAVPPLAPDAADDLVRRVDGLLLTGGEDVDPRLYGQPPHPKAEPPSPERDRWECALVAAARAHALPTLAICRGIQVLNVALGGTLVQDLASQVPGAIVHTRDDVRGRPHAVTVAPETELARCIGAGRITVNSLHHQAIDRPAEGLRVSARADDGVIEAAEWIDPAWWVLAVQWHPEELDQTREPWDRALFRAFAETVSSPAASGIRRAPGA